MSDRLPDADLARLAELDKAATPGPWHRWFNTPKHADHVRAADRSWVAQFAATEADAALIAEARNALPALLVEVSAGRERDARVRALLEQGERGEGIVITPGFTTYHSVDCGLLRAALDGDGEGVPDAR